MLIRQVLLLAAGFSAGAVIAAGLYAFITSIGVMTRLIAKTHTEHRVRLYENAVLLGAALGNAADIYNPPLPGCIWLLAVYAVSAGVFVGCLIMSLAETLNAIPTVSRNIHMVTGMQYVILAIALGKFTGAVIHFLSGMGMG